MHFLINTFSWSAVHRINLVGGGDTRKETDLSLASPIVKQLENVMPSKFIFYIFWQLKTRGKLARLFKTRFS